MILLFAAVAAIVVAITVVLVVGSLLPNGCSCVATVRIAGKPERVLTACNEIARLPTWQPGVTASAIRGESSFVVSGHRGTFEIERMRRDDGFDDAMTHNGDSAGTWSVSVVRDGSSSVVTLRTQRIVGGPFGRFLARHIATPGALESDWLAALSRHLGDPANPIVEGFEMRSL